MRPTPFKLLALVAGRAIPRGTMGVVIEYADMNTFAAEDTKLRGDAEFQALQRDLDKTRKIVSDSIYDEMK